MSPEQEKCLHQALTTLTGVVADLAARAGATQHMRTLSGVLDDLAAARGEVVTPPAPSPVEPPFVDPSTIAHRSGVLTCAHCGTEQQVEQSTPKSAVPPMWSPSLDEVKRPNGERWQDKDGKRFCSAACASKGAA